MGENNEATNTLMKKLPFILGTIMGVDMMAAEQAVMKAQTYLNKMPVSNDITMPVDPPNMGLMVKLNADRIQIWFGLIPFHCRDQAPPPIRPDLGYRHKPPYWWFQPPIWWRKPRWWWVMPPSELHEVR